MVGERLALVIGNDYPNWDNKLNFAVADAKKVKRVLENKEICVFDKVYYFENKTSQEVSSAIEKILKKADRDFVFIYFSGHGIKDFENDLCLLFKNTKEDDLYTTSLTFDFINKCIRYPSRKSVVIVLDCCYSGLAGIRDGNTDVTENFKKLSGLGTLILTATGSIGDTTAKENERLGHGVFTYYLIEGLEKGYADKDGDGYISIDEFYEYAYKKTKENSLQSPAKKGSIEGNVFIGINPKKIKEKDYELKKKKLLDEFGSQLPPDILGECQATLRKCYKNHSPLETGDKIILGYIESLLKDDLLPEKREDAIQNCIEAVQHQKKVEEQKRKQIEEAKESQEIKQSISHPQVKEENEDKSIFDVRSLDIEKLLKATKDDVTKQLVSTPSDSSKKNRAVIGIVGIILGILLIFTLASYIGSDSSNANSSQLSDVNRSYFSQVKYDSSAWENQKYSCIRVRDKCYVPLKPDSNKTAELVVDSGDKYTIRTGEKFEFDKGYTLEAKQVEVDGEKVWFELYKDGEYIDDQIVSPDSGDGTWTCIVNNLQGEDNVPVLKVHVSQVFQGAVDSIAQIDGLWLIDFTNVSSVTPSN